MTDIPANLENRIVITGYSMDSLFGRTGLSITIQVDAGFIVNKYRVWVEDGKIDAAFVPGNVFKTDFAQSETPAITDAINRMGSRFIEMATEFYIVNKAQFSSNETLYDMILSQLKKQRLNTLFV